MMTGQVADFTQLL